MGIRALLGYVFFGAGGEYSVTDKIIVSYKRLIFELQEKNLQNQHFLFCYRMHNPHYRGDYVVKRLYF